MSRPIARYRPSRRYAVFALLAFLAALPTAWAATRWGTAWVIASVLFALTAGLTLLLAIRPAIEVHETHLRIGRRVVFWHEVERLDRIAVGNREPWTAPLLVRMTITGNQEILLFHPGDVDSCVSLLRHIYRCSRSSLLDGVPYREFWGDQPSARAPLALPPPRLLLAEDEDEVERMFQRLKTVGHLENDDSGQDHHGAGSVGTHGSDES